MQIKKIVAVASVATAVASLLALSAVTANGAVTTYPVDIAPNGVGACPTSTGGLSSVTYNTSTSVIRINCPSPNGFAWGRDLDTPDRNSATATIVDDGSEVALGWTPGNMNSSRGLKLGLGLKIGDMRVRNTDLTFVEANDLTQALFGNDQTGLTPPQSRRPNLSLALPKVPWLQDGAVACADSSKSEVPGITWTPGDTVGNKGQVRKYTPKVLLDCTSLKGDKGDNANVGTFRASDTQTMTPDSSSQKLMTGSVSCDASQTAVTGGYDISASTTSQWPMILSNGPIIVSGKATGWKVIVAVPSQSSSSAKAALKVWVSCS